MANQLDFIRDGQDFIGTIPGLLEADSSIKTGMKLRKSFWQHVNETPTENGVPVLDIRGKALLENLINHVGSEGQAIETKVNNLLSLINGNTTLSNTLFELYQKKVKNDCPSVLVFGNKLHKILTDGFTLIHFHKVNQGLDEETDERKYGQTLHHVASKLKRQVSKCTAKARDHARLVS